MGSKSSSSSNSSSYSRNIGERKNVDICDNNDRYDNIISITKIKAYLKGRKGAIAGRVFGSIFTLGLINISEDLRQLPEHWGLIFETEKKYYVVQYTDGGIRHSRSYSFQNCIDDIISCGDHYDRKLYDEEDCNFRSGIDLGDVEREVKNLTPYFNENNYDVLRNNCQYFVKDLLKRIR